MNEVKLSVPEGYFEESLSKTLDRSRKIRTRRRAALCVAASLALIVGIWQFRTILRPSQIQKMYDLEREWGRP
jgi:hypothetical protein